MALTLFSYRRGKSLIHKLHPLIKLFMMFGFCFICFFNSPFELIKLGVLALFILTLFFLARCNARTLYSLKPVIFICFIVSLTRILNNTAECFNALIYCIRLIEATLGCQILFETTSSLEIGYALETAENAICKIFPPFKKLKLSLTLSLCINFIPQVFETWNRVNLASRARSKKSSPGILNSQLSALFSCLLFQAEQKRRALQNRSHIES